MKNLATHSKSAWKMNIKTLNTIILISYCLCTMKRFPWKKRKAYMKQYDTLRAEYLQQFIYHPQGRR